jgi:hypothetical protein
MWFNCVQQSPAGLRNLDHRALKSFLIANGRLVIPADLAHELQRRRVQFLRRRGFAWLAKHFDASAHAYAVSAACIMARA